MHTLQELTQRFIDTGIPSFADFKGSVLEVFSEDSRFTFLWVTPLMKADFLLENSELLFAADTIAESFGSSAHWRQVTDDSVSLSFSVSSDVDELRAFSIFPLQEIIYLTPTPSWEVRAFFGVESPEQLVDESYNSALDLCDFLDREPVWMLERPSAEDNEGGLLSLRLKGYLTFEEPRNSFYEDDFVTRYQGDDADWQFTLLDLKNQGYTSEDVIRMFDALDENVKLKEENVSVSEAANGTVPDTSDVVKGYGVVEDKLFGKEVVYFLIGKNQVEYRYSHRFLNAKEALESYLDDIREVTGSLGISYNKYIKQNDDFEEIMSSRNALRKRDFEEAYISPKEVGSSITARKSLNKNIEMRTGKRS